MVLNDYKYFAWIPTIKGNLTLDLTQDVERLLGDADKYSFNIKCGDKAIVIASSLQMTADSRCKNCSRIFRYFFWGYVRPDGPLFKCIDAHMLITHKEDEDYGFCDEEAKILQAMGSLQNSENNYPEAENVKTRIEKYSKENTEGVLKHKFELRISHDGILLFNSVPVIAEGVVPKENISLCEQVMIFTKYLFHKNYYHAGDNDVLLPVSVIPDDSSQCGRIYSDQMAHLQDVVTYYKRGKIRYKLNPLGILLYASSMVNVFLNNDLISDVEAAKTLRFLEIQKSDIQVAMRKENAVLDSVLAQEGFWLILTESLVVESAVAVLIQTFVDVTKPSILEFLVWWMIVTVILCTLIKIVHVCVIKRIDGSPHLAGRKIKRRRIKLFAGKSNVNKEKLSVRQSFGQKYTGSILNIGRVSAYIILVLLISIAIGFLIWLVYKYLPYVLL